MVSCVNFFLASKEFDWVDKAISLQIHDIIQDVAGFCTTALFFKHYLIG